MKRSISIILVALMLISVLTACAPKQEPAPTPAAPVGGETPDKENVHFAIIFGTGGLGDNGYNDEVYLGCQMAAEKFGATFDYAEPRDITEFETQLRMFADAGVYDTIIAISTEQVDALKMVAEDYPEQRFTMIDTIIEGYDNIRCITASHPEQHFLSGMLAGLATQDSRFPLVDPTNNIVGFTIAMDTPTSRAQASGFIAGAKYANPDIEILTNFIGGYTDPVTAKELAMVMYERGADIVSANAGSSTQGVFQAGKEMNRYVIGTSLAMVDPAISLSTSVKKVWNFIVAEVETLDKGEWEPGFEVLGIAQGVCDYNVEGLDVQIPDDIIKILEDTKLLIADGTLVLPTDLDQVDAWAANNKLAR
jgi:basic membrane protein A